MTLIQELRWRGMIQDIMPGTEELFQKETDLEININVQNKEKP